MPKIQQYHDPDDLTEAVRGLPAHKRRIVGVDLGTNCGVAWADIDPKDPARKARIVAGQLDLSVGPYDTGPLRHVRLKQFLSVLKPDLLAFEDVKFSPDIKGFGGKRIGMIVARIATAAELLGGFKITLCTWAEEHDVPATGYAIGTIKKHATGKGNANKVQMIEAANERFGVKLDPVDYEKSGADNIADAMHICDMAISHYKDGI